MKTKLMRIVIAAGGTGGHVFPALALAKALQTQGIEVCWLGTAKGLEAKIAPKHHIPLHLIPVLPWRGKKMVERLRAPFAFWQAFSQTQHFLRVFKPDVVIGFGGYVSAPGGLAAFRLGIPLIIHEQNSIAGLTNRYLHYLARITLQAFPHAFSSEKASIKTVGNPLREDFFNQPPPAVRWRARSLPEVFCLLVLGGSLGALKLNETVPHALSLLKNKAFKVLHQTGEKGILQAKQNYEKSGLEPHQYELKPFIEDMAEAYAAADLVICRAGALTVAELTALGVPAILVPYPYAVDDHQTKNALYLVNAGAALLLPQSEFTKERVAELIHELMQDTTQRERMAMAAYQLRRPDVVTNLIQICEEAVY